MTIEAFPRPKGATISPSELRPADVLLYLGDGSWSRDIVKLDGGSYSHAALWSGKCVIEAVPDGILESKLHPGYDVYRHRGTRADGDATIEEGMAKAVVDYAASQLGEQYAYTEIYLLAALYKMGVKPDQPLLEASLRHLGRYGEHLKTWLDQLGPTRAPRICSELVAEAFWSSDATRGHALRILPRDKRGRLAPQQASRGVDDPTQSTGWDPGEVDLDAYASLTRSCSALIDGPSAQAYKKIIQGVLARQEGTELGLGHVTPGDLQFSPSLRFVGHLHVE